METSTNSQRTSYIRPPSRVQVSSPGKGLHEITDSEHNARAQPPSMLPPPKSLKHKVAGLIEPEPKRKTLAERAGEMRSAASATSSSLMARPRMKGSALVSGAPASRSISNTSFSSSVGSGSRSTSIVRHKPNNSSLPGPRSASSMGIHNSASTARPEWDMDSRLNNINVQVSQMEKFFKGNDADRQTFSESLAIMKTYNAELKERVGQLNDSNTSIQNEVVDLREVVQAKKFELEELARSHRHKLDDIDREHAIELDYFQREFEQVERSSLEERTRTSREHESQLDDINRKHEQEIDRLKREHQILLERTVRDLEQESDKVVRAFEKEIEIEKSQRQIENLQYKSQNALEQQNLDITVQAKDREIQALKLELEQARSDKLREQVINEGFQANIAESATTIRSVQNENQDLRAHVQFLESGSKSQSDRFTSMQIELQAAKEHEQQWRLKAIELESNRRILYNELQELKGNIRVMCRVRAPASDGESQAMIEYPDNSNECKELVLFGQEEKSALGKVSRKANPFAFDHVFGPESQNVEIFGEIQQMVQSVLDGYNVCIFAYGQTGAGKTYTMSSADGMIPRAMQFIYETASDLQDKGWEYSMAGNFVEVYNEEIHDLLGNTKEFDKKKHDIHHDEVKKQTTITGLNAVKLDSPDAVEDILSKAAANRSVAATNSNERSSRSHSVFILKLSGKNSITGETCEGTLNLVDLAGSERLKQSGAEGDRKKETQNINKSLSCLGDVIAALGQGKDGGHIPYRNSKLTYLLQYSLGGNSKTLMFVMVSPLEAHLRETLTSLKFATKVHNTHIGTAKKVIK